MPSRLLAFTPLHNVPSATQLVLRVPQPIATHAISGVTIRLRIQITQRPEFRYFAKIAILQQDGPLHHLIMLPPDSTLPEATRRFPSAHFATREPCLMPNLIVFHATRFSMTELRITKHRLIRLIAKCAILQPTG